MKRGVNNGSNNGNYKHGLKHTKEYSLWLNMKQRCYNKNYYKYENWGGRGIKVYSKWVNDSESFIQYIKTLENYGDYSLDRIDNDGNYEPGNLRWCSGKTQNSNKRKPNNNTSGYTGICYHKKTNKYVSRISNIFIGRYKTKEDAVIARNDYIIQNGLSEYKIQNIL